MPDGIVRVFEFASPQNRRHTGPLNRFKRMIRGGYGHLSASTAPRSSTRSRRPSSTRI